MTVVFELRMQDNVIDIKIVGFPSRVQIIKRVKAIQGMAFTLWLV